MNKDPQKINLSLVSHTNVGKTTLARTLLGRDIGEVGDRSHVTTEPEDYVLLRAPHSPTQSDRLVHERNLGSLDG